MRHPPAKPDPVCVQVILDSFGIHSTDSLREVLIQNKYLSEEVRRLKHPPSAKAIILNGYRACGNCEKAVRPEWDYCPHCGRRLV